MAEQVQTDGQTNEQEKSQENKEESKTVAFETYDKAMKTVAKRGEEVELLKSQLAELQSVVKENQKSASPDKYVESLEEENSRIKSEYESIKNDYSEFKKQSEVVDQKRSKLADFWTAAIAEGMQADKQLLQFVDIEAIKVDEAGSVNEKSIQAELNRLKKEKSYIFNIKTPEEINQNAPGDSGSEKPKSLFEQLGEQIK